MIVECNLPQGIKIFSLKLNHGPNVVDDDEWEAATARLDPRFLAGLQAAQPGGMPPYLVVMTGIVDELDGFVSVARAEPEPEPEAEDTPAQMNVAEKLALVRRASTVEELNEMKQGEDRKTVLVAIHKRAAKLRGGKAG